MINVLYYEYWTDKQKYLYAYHILFKNGYGESNVYSYHV